MISVKEFKDRRARLEKELDNDSVLILYAGVSKKMSNDLNYDFEVNHNFFYLTNIEQEGSILLVTKCDDVITEYLFISEYDPNKEKWTGVRLDSEEACKYSGVNNVLYLNTFDAQLSMVLDKKEHVYGNFDTLYLDLEREIKVDEGTTTREIKERLGLNYSYLKFKDVSSIISSMRALKSAQEVEELKLAVSKTNIGINKLLKSIQPGLFEYQLSALFDYSIRDLDNSKLAFRTVCSSGSNAIILNNHEQNDKIKDGDLVLMDVGAKNSGYCSYVSRTYPANGRFTLQQKFIYNIVLDCNKLILKTIRPGISLKDLQDKAIEFMGRKCMEGNLIKSLDEITKVFYHPVSYQIGLDIHEPVSREEPIQSGNIITDGPGLYFKELGIGVRIADVILVTDDGCYCLSGNIIKEVNDIEKAMLYR